MSRKRIAWYLALGTMVLGSWTFAYLDTEPERVRDDVPESLANCVAEQAYVNPMDDKFKELENAIAICTTQGESR